MTICQSDLCRSRERAFIEKDLNIKEEEGQERVSKSSDLHNRVKKIRYYGDEMK